MVASHLVIMRICARLSSKVTSFPCFVYAWSQIPCSGLKTLAISSRGIPCGWEKRGRGMGRGYEEVEIGMRENCEGMTQNFQLTGPSKNDHFKFHCHNHRSSSMVRSVCEPVHTSSHVLNYCTNRFKQTQKQ